MDLDFQPENLPPRPEKTQGPAPTPIVSSQPTNQPPPPTPQVVPPAPPPPPPLQAAPKKRSLLPILIILLVLAAAIALVVIVVLPRLRQSASTTTTTTFEQETAPTPQATLPSTTTPAGRDATRKQDLKKIETNLAAYFADNQTYPIVGLKEQLNSDTSIVVKALVPKYTSSLPVDPLDPEFWYGYQSVDGKSYELSARLEVSTDAQAVLVGSKYLFIIKK